MTPSGRYHHDPWESPNAGCHGQSVAVIVVVAWMWDKMKDWLLHGAIHADEKLAWDLAGPGYHINRSNLLVLESNSDMQKRGQASRGSAGADLRAVRGARHLLPWLLGFVGSIRRRVVVLYAKIVSSF